MLDLTNETGSLLPRLILILNTVIITAPIVTVLESKYLCFTTFTCIHSNRSKVPVNKLNEHAFPNKRSLLNYQK